MNLPVNRMLWPVKKMVCVGAVSTLAAVGGVVAPSLAASAAPRSAMTVHLVSSLVAPATSGEVHFTLTASDPDARGALGYVLNFGDGKSTHTVTPQFCTATGTTRAGKWTITHRYAARGTYVATVTVVAGCTAGHGTARLAVKVG